LRAEASRALSMALRAGIILIAWIVAQVTVIGRRSRLQDAMALLGFAVVILSFFLPSPG